MERYCIVNTEKHTWFLYRANPPSLVDDPLNYSSDYNGSVTAQEFHLFV